MNKAVSSGVIGLGIDLVDVARFEEVLNRQGERFLARVFTEEERRYCGSKQSPAAFYAARFAAKEAVSKAFGTGIGAEIGWLDIEVFHDAAGAPLVRLSGKGAELADLRGVTRVLVSLTHTTLGAAASVVLQ